MQECAYANARSTRTPSSAHRVVARDGVSRAAMTPGLPNVMVAWKSGREAICKSRNRSEWQNGYHSAGPGKLLRKTHVLFGKSHASGCPLLRTRPDMHKNAGASPTSSVSRIINEHAVPV